MTSKIVLAHKGLLHTFSILILVIPNPMQLVEVARKPTWIKLNQIPLT